MPQFNEARVHKMYAHNDYRFKKRSMPFDPLRASDIRNRAGRPIDISELARKMGEDGHGAVVLVLALGLIGAGAAVALYGSSHLAQPGSISHSQISPPDLYQIDTEHPIIAAPQLTSTQTLTNTGSSGSLLKTAQQQMKDRDIKNSPRFQAQAFLEQYFQKQQLNIKDVSIVFAQQFDRSPQNPDKDNPQEIAFAFFNTPDGSLNAAILTENPDGSQVVTTSQALILPVNSEVTLTNGQQNVTLGNRGVAKYLNRDCVSTADAHVARMMLCEEDIMLTVNGQTIPFMGLQANSSKEQWQVPGLVVRALRQGVYNYGYGLVALIKQGEWNIVTK